MRIDYRMLVLKILPLLLLFFLSSSSFGQEIKNRKNNERTFKDRLFIGGSLGFSFGSNSSLIEVSPIVGYAVTEKFVVGLGLTYKYYRYKDYYALIYTDSTGNLYVEETYDFKSNIYGGSIWARYFLKGVGIPIIENLFFHVEFEPLVFTNNYILDPYGDISDGYNWYSEGSQRTTLSGIFLGGGLQQPLGGRSYMYLEILYNFNEELYSPYSNPRIRIGVAAAL